MRSIKAGSQIKMETRQNIVGTVTELTIIYQLFFLFVVCFENTAIYSVTGVTN